MRCCCSASCGGAKALTARDMLRLGTRGGAAVLGRDDIGYLAPGMAADFAGVRPRFARACRRRRPRSACGARLLPSALNVDFTDRQRHAARRATAPSSALDVERLVAQSQRTRSRPNLVRTSHESALRQAQGGRRRTGKLCAVIAARTRSGRERHIGDPRAGRVVDRAATAAPNGTSGISDIAARAERSLRIGRFHDDRIDFGRARRAPSVRDSRKCGVRMRPFDDAEIFGQRVADRLRDAAFDLRFDLLAVDRAADVVHADHTLSTATSPVVMSTSTSTACATYP